MLAAHLCLPRELLCERARTLSPSSLVLTGVILSAMLSVIFTLCFMHSVSAFMYCFALMNR